MSILDVLARPQPGAEGEGRAVRRAGSAGGQRLRLVPRASAPTPRAPFVVLVLAILGAGLVGLLLLNTSLQQGSFVRHELERQVATVAERQGLLEQELAAMLAPDALADRARQLGMVSNPDPVFVRLTESGAELTGPGRAE